MRLFGAMGVLFWACVFYSGISFANGSRMDQPLFTLMPADQRFRLMRDLQSIDPEIRETTPVRHVITDRFYRRIPHRLYTGTYRADFEQELRRYLAAAGLAINLTAQEMELLEREPRHILFRPIRNIRFHPKLYFGQSIAYRLEQNCIFLVVDFLKYYDREIARTTKSTRFNTLVNFGPKGVLDAAGVIFTEVGIAELLADQKLSACESALSR